METATATVRALQDDTTWHHLVPRLLREHGSRVVAEVGVWRGELSTAILRDCPEVQRLILVDPWAVVYGHDIVRDQWLVFGPGTTQHEMDEAYQHVCHQFRGDARVRVRRDASVVVASEIPDGSLDAVVIDALHTYQACKEDILAWRPKLREGGLMIGDDYSEWFPGVQMAVEEIVGRHRVLGQTWWVTI
jgi:hypothetical protein